MRRSAGWGLLTLTLAVAAVHGLTASWLASQLVPPAGGAAAGIRRIDIAFVRDLQPVQAPAAAAPAAPVQPQRARAAWPPASAASAAPADEPPLAVPVEPTVTAGAPVDAPPPEAVAQAASAPAPYPPPGMAASTQAQTAAVAGPPAQAASASGTGIGDAAAFEWPPSTRLSYTMVGDYRGPVHGTAQVEWLRRGDRYQVHLEVRVPGLMSRRMSSEGRVTDQGLAPSRYEEVTTVLLAEPRRLSVRFEADRIVLANGQVQPALDQVQDSASQFVQLTWLFTTRSELLRLGQKIEVPLALPRRVDLWVYDIHAQEDIDTPLGRLRTYHMKPRRMPPPKGALAVETWFAPSLQYLPVRIVIRQDEQTYLDLTLSRAPQQEAAGRVDARRMSD